MNDQITWDSSLIKKFSSSNHYKLLNQLRNEVIKYPLNKKKDLTLTQTNQTNKDIKNNSNFDHTQSQLSSKNSIKLNDENSTKSKVSFNNSKNFSIYNQAANNNISRQNERIIPDQSNSNNSSSSQGFKDRLNQIDMK